MVDMSSFFLKDDIEFLNHQKSGIKWMSRRRDFIQGDDMGLGKTLQTLATFGTDLKRGLAGNGAAIVVCPNSVVGNWYEEVKKFTLLQPVVLGEVEGRKTRLTPMQRKLQIAEFATTPGPKIIICSYEILTAHGVMLSKLKFHLGIFDEAHKLQNPESKRTSASVEFAESLTRVAVLTGTPVLNEVGNLWALLRMTRAEHRGHKAFLNRYAVMENRKITIKHAVGKKGDADYKPAVTKTERKVVGVKRASELRAKLYGDEDLQKLVATDPKYRQRVIDDPDFRVRVYGMMIRRLKENVLDLPPVHKVPVYVDMSPKQRELYLQALEEFIIDLPDGDSIEIDNSFVRFAHLKQICGSTFKFTGEDDSAKLDRAVELVEDIIRGSENKKIVVFTQFRDINDLFAARIRDGRGINTWQLHGGVPARDRVGVIHEWGDSPGHGVIVAGLQVTAEGLNMTQSRDVIFLDKLFVPKLNDQAIDRVNRIGQQLVHPITVYELITRFSVELRVEQICKAKRDLFDNLIEGDERQAFKLMAKDLVQQAQELRKESANA